MCYKNWIYRNIFNIRIKIIITFNSKLNVSLRVLSYSHPSHLHILHNNSVEDTILSEKRNSILRSYDDANVSNREYIDIRPGFVNIYTMTSRGFLVSRGWTIADYQSEAEVGEEMKRKMLKRKAKKRETERAVWRRLVGVLVPFVNRISIGSCIKATRAYTFFDLRRCNDRSVQCNAVIQGVKIKIIRNTYTLKIYTCNSFSHIIINLIILTR